MDVGKPPQSPHGTQVHTTETAPPIVVSKKLLRIEEARKRAYRERGTNMGRNQRMSDTEWRERYGDKPRMKGTGRGRSKLRHGRQAGDVTAVLSTFQPDDKFTATIVWDLFDGNTQADWIIAYGERACVSKVRHVLSNITGGNTAGPHIVRGPKGNFVYKPTDALGLLDPRRTMAAAVVSAIGMEQEAAASVALDGETQSFDEPTEPPPFLEEPTTSYTIGMGSLTHIGHTLDGSSLYMDNAGIVGTVRFTPLTP